MELSQSVSKEQRPFRGIWTVRFSAPDTKLPWFLQNQTFWNNCCTCRCIKKDSFRLRVVNTWKMRGRTSSRWRTSGSTESLPIILTLCPFGVFTFMYFPHKLEFKVLNQLFVTFEQEDFVVDWVQSALNFFAKWAWIFQACTCFLFFFQTGLHALQRGKELDSYGKLSMQTSADVVHAL